MDNEVIDNPGLFNAEFTIFLESNYYKKDSILEILDDGQKLVVVSTPKRPFWNAIFHFLFPRWIGKKYKYKVKIIQDDN